MIKRCMKASDNNESPTLKDQPNHNAIRGDSSLVQISTFSSIFSQCLHEFTVYFKLESVKKEKPHH